MTMSEDDQPVHSAKQQAREETDPEGSQWDSQQKQRETRTLELAPSWLSGSGDPGDTALADAEPQGTPLLGAAPHWSWPNPAPGSE